MTDFHLTRMGQQFYQGTMPGLVKAIDRLAAAIEEHNKTMAAASEKEITFDSEAIGRTLRKLKGSDS